MPKGPTPIAVQSLVCRLFGVHHYDDVFEKIVRWKRFSSGRRGGLFRRRIDPAVLASRPLFIHIPKNAGTSIATAIYGHSPGHKTAYFYRTAAPDLFARTPAFAVLRDPIERFVSAYWFIRNQGGDQVSIEPGFARSLRGVESVDQLLDFIEAHMSGLYALDHVLRPQIWYLSDPRGKLLVDRLFVLNETDAELAGFLKAHGVDQIPFRNRTDKGALLLTEGQAARIRRLYEADVRLVERLRAGGDAAPARTAAAP